MFDNTRPAYSFFYCTLNNCFVSMVSPFFAGFRVLPSPFGRSVGILAIQCSWQKYTSPTFSKVFIMNAFDLFQMVGERLFQRFRQHRDPVFCPLSITNQNFITGEINILYT